MKAGRNHLTEYLTSLKDKLEPSETNRTQLIDKFLKIIEKDRFFQIFRELDQESC
jgi:hypothetical protein